MLSILYRDFFKTESIGSKLLVVQCDYGERNSDLIACARHRLMDERCRPTVCGITHVLFIIQLPRVAGGTAFTSFQGGQWLSVHIDELACSEGANEIIKYALSEPLQKFFNMLIENDRNIPSDFKVCTRIRDNIQLAVSRIISAQTYQQMERVIDILLELISDELPSNLGNQYYLNLKAISFSSTELPCSFTACLLARFMIILQQKDDNSEHPDEWAVNTALDRHQLQTSFTLVNSIKKLLDKQIQLILSYIVSCVDKNNNLDLLMKEDVCLKNLWLTLFRNESFLHLHHTDIVTSSVAVTNIKKRIYMCQFPFSWEISDQIEAISIQNILFSVRGI